jgi:hypothetical protein
MVGREKSLGVIGVKGSYGSRKKVQSIPKVTDTKRELNITTSATA